MTATAAPVRAHGRNASAGSEPPTAIRGYLAAHRCATHRGTTRSARISDGERSSRSRSVSSVDQGGLATTRYGVPGSAVVLTVMMPVPGAGELMLYQPLHPTAHDL